MSPNIKVKGRQKSCCWWCLNMTAVHLHVSWGNATSMEVSVCASCHPRGCWREWPDTDRLWLWGILFQLCYLNLLARHATPLWNIYIYIYIGGDSSPLVAMCWISSFCMLTGQSQHFISQHERRQNQLINSVFLKSKINRCKLQQRWQWRTDHRITLYVVVTISFEGNVIDVF